MYKKKISLLSKIYKNKYQNTYFNTNEVKRYFKIRKDNYSKFLKKQIQYSRTQERLDNTSKFFLTYWIKKSVEVIKKNCFYIIKNIAFI